MTEPTIPLSKSARQTRIPELDGLRGTAIFLVAILHYVAVPGSRLQYFVLRFVSIGWTGVDLFFVLSGFLIGGILLDVRNSPSRFKTFYARRFFRIIPIYYAWILFYALIVIIGAFVPAVAETNVMLSPTQLMGIDSLFLQNIFFRLDGPLSDVWFRSLAVEEQFYLVVPLLITLLSRRTLTKLLISIIVGAPLLRLATVFSAPGDVSSSWLTYTLTPCRADALACGVLAAILWRNARFLEWASKKNSRSQCGFLCPSRWRLCPVEMVAATSIPGRPYHLAIHGWRSFTQSCYFSCFSSVQAHWPAAPARRGCATGLDLVLRLYHPPRRAAFYIQIGPAQDP
jgi:peptidoglycan/LPS O-acetylase OafA/YrhL